MRYWFIAVTMAMVAMFSIVSIVDSAAVYAQGSQQAACEGAGGNWDAAEGRCGEGQAAVGSLFQRVGSTLLFLLGAVAVIMLIIGGFRYVVSAGDANALQGAKNTILYAIVGIVVAFMAWAAVNFVVTRLGTDSPRIDSESLLVMAPDQVA